MNQFCLALYIYFLFVYLLLYYMLYVVKCFWCMCMYIIYGVCMYVCSYICVCIYFVSLWQRRMALADCQSMIIIDQSINLAIYRNVLIYRYPLLVILFVLCCSCKYCNILICRYIAIIALIEYFTILA